MTGASHRPRVAWFAGGGGTVATLSSYCLDLLLPLLKERFEVELFTDDVEPRSCNLPVHHFSTAFRRHREEPFDLFFYQLEDGTPSQFVRMHIGLHPGVVWVHDLFLRDRGPEGVRTSPWEETVAQYGEIARYQESARTCGSAPSLSVRGDVPRSQQLWPRAYREISLSPVVLCSSRWGVAECEKLISGRIEPYPGGHRIEYVPVPVVCGDTQGGGTTPRHHSTAQSQNSVLRLASAGSVSVEDHSHKILAALRNLPVEWHLTWLVAHDEAAHAAELVREFSGEGRVTIVEGRSVHAWQEILGQVDCALHLRRTPFGSLAPYLQLSLAKGVPVVVLDAFEGSGLPAEAVFRVTPDLTEEGVLRELFVWLSHARREEVARAGREYVLRESGVPVVARRLMQLFEESIEGVKQVMGRWEVLERRAAEGLLADVLALAGDGVPGIPVRNLIEPVLCDLLGLAGEDELWERDISKHFSH